MQSHTVSRFAVGALAVLALLVGTTPPVAAQQAPVRGKVVMQVSDADPAKWNLALNNAKNVQADLGAANVDIEIVAYGPGIGMLKAESVVAQPHRRSDGRRRQGRRMREHAAGAEAHAAPTCCRRSTTSPRAWSSSCRSSSRAGRTSGRSRRARVPGARTDERTARRRAVAHLERVKGIEPSS